MTWAEEVRILRHALGLGEDGRGKSYRSSFVTGPGGRDFTICRELSARGLMTDHGPEPVFGGMHHFMVTDQGRELAIAPPLKLSRAKRRYRKWLSIADAYWPATFGDFLTQPEFAAARTDI